MVRGRGRESRCSAGLRDDCPEGFGSRSGEDGAEGRSCAAIGPECPHRAVHPGVRRTFAVATYGGCRAIVEAFRALRPTITRQAPSGLVFFGDIAALSLNDYVKHAL